VVTQSTVGLSLLGSRSLGTFRSKGQNTNYNRVIHEQFKVVIYIRFAWKLVQFKRVQLSAFARELNDSVGREFRSSAVEC
jgi:hypothetical protein